MRYYRIRPGSIADLVVNYSGYLAFALCMIALGVW